MSFSTRFGSALLSVLLLGSAAGAARDAGTTGRTWEIAEPDALREIQERAARVDWSRVVTRERLREVVAGFRPAGLHPLPGARETRSFQVDMSYRLDRDVPDGRGGYLYRRGYTFNPLDHVRLSSLLVVIDGRDPKQVAWFRESPYAGDYRTRLLLSDGDYAGLAEELERPVFYLMEEVAERLRLRAVPSIVYQAGRKLEVTEVGLDAETE